LIAFEVLTQEAKRQGMDKESEYTKRKEWLKKEMERETQNILISMLLKKELAGKLSPPTEKEVEEYYNSHKNEMRTRDGRKVSLKEASADISNFLSRKKMQDASTEYANGLKKNVKVEIDEKALDAALASLSTPSVQKGLQMQTPPVPGDSGKK
jgi:hypothetical protein